MYVNFVNSFKITIKHSNNKKVKLNNSNKQYHMVLCTAALLPELQPAPCLLCHYCYCVYAIIGQTWL